MDRGLTVQVTPHTVDGVVTLRLACPDGEVTLLATPAVLVRMAAEVAAAALALAGHL